jgi:hypothetical protein
MAISLSKAVPRMVVVAAVGYCVWPSLPGLTSVPTPAPVSKLPEIAGSLLAPRATPPPIRNPFLYKEAEDLAKNKAMAKLASANGKKLGSPGKGGGDDPAGPGRSQDPLSGLSLDATCIAGDSRLAIINGHIYGVKKRISGSSAAAPALTIAAVLPYKVLLECDGKTLELFYSTISRSDAPPSGESAISANAQTSTNVRPRTSLIHKSHVGDSETSEPTPPRE